MLPHTQWARCQRRTPPLPLPTTPPKHQPGPLSSYKPATFERQSSSSTNTSTQGALSLSRIQVFHAPPTPPKKTKKNQATLLRSCKPNQSMHSYKKRILLTWGRGAASQNPFSPSIPLHSSWREWIIATWQSREGLLFKLDQEINQDRICFGWSSCTKGLRRANALIYCSNKKV